jgi:hypothetical protein
VQAPHFVTLVQIDRRHTISACRHGIVHLHWKRSTIRFREDEFRRLTSLVEQAVIAEAPPTTRDGTFSVVARNRGDSEIGLGSMTLLLAPAEWEAFAEALPTAVGRLDDLRNSGAWDQSDPQESPPSPLERLRQTHFSDN